MPWPGLAALVLGPAILAGCSRAQGASADMADVHAGQVAIEREACGSCHRIPGVPLADGRVGPSLAHFGSRQTIAGTLGNSSAGLVAYLQDPELAGRGNVMPNIGLQPREAQEIAAYLETLR